MIREVSDKLKVEKHDHSSCFFSTGYKSKPKQRGVWNHVTIVANQSRQNLISHLNLALSCLLVFAIAYSILLAVLGVNIFAQSSLPSSSSSSSSSTPISGQTDRVPSFLEAYWTDGSISSSTSPSNNSKKEVGPGDGTSTLAVVLVNKGRTDITGVTGYLTLPPGFRSIEGENNVTSPHIAVASHDSIVPAGDSFTMYFAVDVLPQATVGPYSSNLRLSYSKILEVGQISSSMTIPFRLTGKVILDTILLNQNLTAGYTNPLQILITNDGTSNATGAVVTISGVSGGTLATNSSSNDTSLDGASFTTVDSETFNIGNIPAGRSVVITPVVYPEYSSGGTIQTLDLRIAYNNAYGMRTNSDYSVGMIVAPNPPESVLSISPRLMTTPSTSQNYLNDNNESREGSRGKGVDTGEKPNENSIVLTAGKLENLRFSITNNGSLPLTDLVFSISSGTNSVKILGDSRWSLDYMAPLASYLMSTTVYAAEDVINTPTEFNVNAEYIERGQSKTDSLDIGAYVDGQIRIRSYDLAINNIGGTPNLVGNLLNEGNTVALFTTIELVNSAAESGPEGKGEEEQPELTRSLVTGPTQLLYLGDLSENSPLPFSVPISIARDLPAGNYPVTLNITYSDNLRMVHKLLLNDTVEYEGQPSTSGSNNSNSNALTFANDFSRFLPIIIIVIAVGIVTVIFIRKRNKRKQGDTHVKIPPFAHHSDSTTFRQQNDADTDIFLDDESSDNQNKL
jgi:hypothetical protein